MRYFRPVLAFALMFAIAASAAALALGEDGPDTVPTTAGARIRDPMAIFDPSVPLMPHGQVIAFAGVAEAVAFPRIWPAVLGEPAESWVVDYGDGIGEIGLRYPDRGVVVLLAAFPQGRDPTVSLRARIQDLPKAYTTTIAGYPAAVLPYDPTLAVAPIDVVYVVADGVEVSFYGDHGKIQIEDLVSAAGSLTTEAPPATTGS